MTGSDSVGEGNSLGSSSILAWRIPWPGEFHGVTNSQTQLSDFHFLTVYANKVMPGKSQDNSRVGAGHARQTNQEIRELELSAKCYYSDPRGREGGQRLRSVMWQMTQSIILKKSEAPIKTLDTGAAQLVNTLFMCSEGDASDSTWRRHGPPRTLVDHAPKSILYNKL